MNVEPRLIINAYMLFDNLLKNKARISPSALLFSGYFLHYGRMIHSPLPTGLTMPTLDPQQLAKRIDTVLDILVAKDYASAINNLEILKAELLSVNNDGNKNDGEQKKSPWEI
jgi:hypothetical protein